MIDPKEEELKAILRLEGNPDWEIVKGWIHRSLYEIIGPDPNGNLKGMMDQILDFEQKVFEARSRLRLIEQRKPKI